METLRKTRDSCCRVNDWLMQYDVFMGRLIFCSMFALFIISGLYSLYSTSIDGIERINKPADMTSRDRFGFYPFFVVPNFTMREENPPPMSIFTLASYLLKLKGQNLSLYEVFFQVHELTSLSIALPVIDQEIADAYNWPKGKANQTVVSIRDRVTKQITSFNDIAWTVKPEARSVNGLVPDVVQPVPRPSVPSSSSCFLCSKAFPQDVNPSLNIVGDFCRVGPAFVKLCPWHAMIIPTLHDPLAVLKPDFVVDYITVAYKWFRAVRALDASANYPSLLWDSGKPSAHNRLHIFLHHENFFAGAEISRIRAVHYELQWSMTNFWKDFATAHQAIGLALQYRRCMVVSSVTPRFARDLFVLSPTGSDECFAMLIFVALEAVMADPYYKRFELSISFDIFDPTSRNAHYPAVANLIMHSIDPVLSGLEETNMGPQAALDPYAIMPSLKSTLQQLSTRA